MGKNSGSRKQIDTYIWLTQDLTTFFGGEHSVFATIRAVMHALFWGKTGAQKLYPCKNCDKQGQSNQCQTPGIKF